VSKWAQGYVGILALNRVHHVRRESADMAGEPLIDLVAEEEEKRRVQHGETGEERQCEGAGQPQAKATKVHRQAADR
jgi:hypothetical protein